MRYQNNILQREAGFAVGMSFSTYFFKLQNPFAKTKKARTFAPLKDSAYTAMVLNYLA